MEDVLFYQLVDAQARDEVDLRFVSRRLTRCIAHVFPEAEQIRVYENFYCFLLPGTSAYGQKVRLQKLGRLIAANMPALCQEAMRHYTSSGHPPSNQLFKRVKSAKWLSRFMDELNA